MKPEITTDNRTVWINQIFCVARFCPISGEILQNDTIIPTKPDWNEWKNKVLEVLAIKVPEKFQPNWSKNAGK